MHDQNMNDMKLWDPWNPRKRTRKQLIGDLKFGILAQAKQIQRSIINAARGGNLAGDVIRKEEATAFGSVIFHLVGRLRPQLAMRTRDLIIINTNNFCTHQ